VVIIMNRVPELEPKTRKANRRLAVILAFIAVGFYVVMVMVSQR
jgi:hypothetical protein